MKKCELYWLLLWHHKHGTDVAVCDHEPEYDDGSEAVLKYFGLEADEWDESTQSLEAFGPRDWLTTKEK